MSAVGEQFDESKPWTGRRVHFVGIGGCGMSGLALVAAQLGATVSGSDTKRSIFFDSLHDTGLIELHLGHDTGNLPAAGEIAYSSAIRSDNVERAAAHERGLTELHRSALLAQLTRMNRTIAVAGAHGKTTTAALLAYVLDQAGLQPTYIVGGLLRKPALHARAGAGRLLVIEADESDRSLLDYAVNIALITNVDLDHVGDAAGYESKDDVADVLARFAKGADLTVGSQQAADELGERLPELVTAVPARTANPTAFVLDDETYDLSLPGWHNAENAALVVRVARELGCSPEAIREALATFPGLARRFELRGHTTNGAKVFDDYAHHPTEVAAVLQAARSVTTGRVIAVFQPHLFSRTQQFTTEFAQSLTLADVTYLEPIYPAREDPAAWDHVSSLDIATALPGSGFHYATDRSALATDLATHTESGDAIVLVGAGDITLLAQQIVTG